MVQWILDTDVDFPRDGWFDGTLVDFGRMDWAKAVERVTLNCSHGGKLIGQAVSSLSNTAIYIKNRTDVHESVRSVMIFVLMWSLCCIS